MPHFSQLAPGKASSKRNPADRRRKTTQVWDYARSTCPCVRYRLRAKRGRAMQRLWLLATLHHLTNKLWFTMVSKWCMILSIHSMAPSGSSHTFRPAPRSHFRKFAERAVEQQAGRKAKQRATQVRRRPCLNKQTTCGKQYEGICFCGGSCFRVFFSLGKNVQQGQKDQHPK